MPITNTPLRYPGGKSSLSLFLAQVIELNDLQSGTYVEPYAGGAGAALNLLFHGTVNHIVINDFDPAIYAFWVSVLNEPDEFVRRISSAPLSIEEWHRQKNILNTHKQQNIFDVGFAAFFLNRCNRSGILKAGPIGGQHQTGTYTIDARFNREDLIKKIRRIERYKERISVYNLDAIDLLQKVVPSIDGPKLVYLDPPYFKKGHQLYLNAYEYDDHENLAWALGKMSSSDFWVLTYDDAQEIRVLYQDNITSTYTLNYSAAKPKQGCELLISPPWLMLPDKIGTKFTMA
ncbi:MAG: DNA adenine methylase [Proteobacteria bacterium]|jgi:DNA adenine methylase|nr:DNA adenine methylase [Desulfocapsa sp.]MBU3944318.1 DNA adenine methylase [Pseudomonadota bacterium]MCG2744085.1 DNA adenine methylase [Desulfobacteraceae bacterium]MBU3984682.1 DNA adenine methylase [Pseudomonadota bacterium]MBU4028087.1 DNA adenine methylase [Pseudomonadota bacterium]